MVWKNDSYLFIIVSLTAGHLPHDFDEFRLGFAEEQGATVGFNPAKVEDMTAAVREYCVEDGVNVVIEATGRPATYPMAIKLACTGGRFVALGSPRGTVEFSFLEDVHLREVTMLGAIQPKTPDRSHIYYRWTKDRDRNLLLQLMAAGKLLPENLVTHVFKPEQCQEVYDMLADCAQEEKMLGVVFDWANA